MIVMLVMLEGENDDNTEEEAVIDERPKSPIEKRKRDLIFFSPISRRERET